MSAITVIPASQLLEAVKTDVTKILTLIPKKNAKASSGVEFIETKWTVGNLVNKDGWFYAENIELTDGVADPADSDDPRNQYERDARPGRGSKMRLQLQTTLSRSGDFGEALHLLNPQFKKQILEMGDKGTIDMDRKAPHDLLQYNLGKKNARNPNGVIEDPILRFQFDFHTYSDKHPIAQLRGRPQVEFLDARTAYKDEKGRTQYKPAQVEINGQMVPVDYKNIHLFVTPGSRIVTGRFSIPSVAVSQSWVSMPIKACRIVLQPGEAGGFSDETFDAPSEIEAIAKLAGDDSDNADNTDNTDTDRADTSDNADTAQPTASAADMAALIDELDL